MTKVNYDIEDDLERRFREKAFQKFGPKKGALIKALEEAIRKWLGER